MVADLRPADLPLPASKRDAKPVLGTVSRNCALAERGEPISMRFFRVWTHRNPDSIFGPASSPVIRNGSFLCFESEEKARAECDRLNVQRRDMQVHYTVEPTHIEALLPQAAAKRSPIEAPSFSALATAPCVAANARARSA